MATFEMGGLRITLSMNAGEFTRNTKTASRDLESLGKTFKRVSDTVEAASYEFNSGMMAAQRMLSTMQGVIRVSSDFGSGMSAVSTLVDTSKESMTAMTEAVLALGRRMPVTLTDITQGLYDLRSAGTSADDAFGRLEGSSKLAVAALGTVQEAVDIVTSAVNAWGLEGEKAEKIYDQVFKATAYGKMTVAQLAQGFGAVAGTVAQAKIEIDEYLSAVAAMTTTGVPAAQAHTMIRAAIAGLTRESELGTKAFKAFGVKSFGELVEKSGGLVGALNNVKLAFGGNDQALIKLLGSTEGYGALLSLTGKQSAVFRQALDDMRNGEEKLGEAFDKRNQGMGATMQTMRNAMDELVVALGTALLPSVVAVRDAIRDVTETFKRLDPETQSMIAKIALIATVIVPAVAALGFFANGLSALIPVITTVGGALVALVAATGPIGLFILAFGAITAAIVVFQDKIMAVFNAVGNYLTEKVNAMMAKLTEFKNYLTSIWDGAAEEMKGGVTTIAKTAGDAFGQVAMQMGGVSVMMDTIKAKNEEAAKNAWTYKGPIISATDAEKESLNNRNTAMREGLQLFNETLDPMEKIIFQQMKINGLWAQGAIDATTYGRAMAQASVFSAKNMDALASSVSSNLSTIFGDTKAVAIATALINTYQGITKALATYPPPIAQAMAAIQAAAGFAQVAAIRKQTSKGGGGGGSGSAAASSPAAVPNLAANQTLTVQGINPAAMYSGEAMRGLAQAMLDYQRNGGQVLLK